MPLRRSNSGLSRKLIGTLTISMGLAVYPYGYRMHGCDDDNNKCVTPLHPGTWQAKMELEAPQKQTGSG